MTDQSKFGIWASPIRPSGVAELAWQIHTSLQVGSRSSDWTAGLFTIFESDHVLLKPFFPLLLREATRDAVVHNPLAIRSDKPPKWLGTRYSR
jgi:hypothetical protein